MRSRRNFYPLFFAAIGSLITVRALFAADQPSSGLSVSFSARESTWRLGMEKTFTATLTNTGTEPFLVDVFGNINEVYEGKRRDTYVLSCWALVWEGVESLTAQHRGRYTLAAEQFVRLEPGESYTAELSLALTEVPIGDHRVRLAYVPRAASTLFSLPNGWEKQQGFVVPMWVGMAFSEPLTFQVID